MPTYKLYYFPGRGRAELIRWIFAQADVPYEDKRIAGEEWAKFKPDTPYGSMPVVEIDGKRYAGSGPLARYLAEQFGLGGSNAIENLEIASISDVVDDLYIKVMIFYFEKDEARKADLKKDLDEKHLPNYLGIINKRITENGSSDGWIYGQKVTYVDLKIALLGDVLTKVNEKTLEPFPAVAKLKTTVEALPNIAKWIKERPVTEF